MRLFRSLALFVPCLCLNLFSSLSVAAPGYFWEIGMEMEGMPFAMPAQKVCAPKGGTEPPVTRGDDECKILEKKMTGKRFQWKAQCKDGLMVGDVTSTPTSYSGSLKMTESSGSTMSMKMSGKRLGECDYQDRSGEIKAIQNQVEGVIASTCQQALTEMQGAMMGRQCPKETPLYCKRIATLDGYALAARIPEQIVGVADDEAASMIAERTGEIAKPCKFDSAKLRATLCKRALSESNFDFVSRLCPGDRAKLCKPAAAANRLGYVNASCPAEREALIKAHCEGRKYSSDIEPRYLDFCSNAGMLGETAPAVSAAQSNSAPGDPAGTVKEVIIDQGIKKLRGLFGF
ncbi:MAG: hypothetical protein B7Y41_00810 [Hydrogenophilales bacterium 28-61-23]|nr:MAG: hypothetical protein B7Y41_00810 [Hydrogenophilales bacterium 28-61-23]